LLFVTAASFFDYTWGDTGDLTRFEEPLIAAADTAADDELRPRIAAGGCDDERLPRPSAATALLAPRVIC